MTISVFPARFWESKMKKALLRATILTLGVFLLSTLPVRFFGWLPVPALREYAAVFRQLLHARMSWHPALPSLFFLLCVLFFRNGKHLRTKTALLAVGGFLAAALCLRVNGVPLTAAVQAALTILG